MAWFLKGQKVVGLKSLRNLLAAAVLLQGFAAFGRDPLSEARRSFDEGRLEETIEILNRRLETRPKDEEALKLRGLAQSGLGHFDAAGKDFEDLLNERPADAETHLDLGMLLALKIKDARHAMIHLDQYLSFENDREKSAKAAKVMVSLDRGHSKLENRALKDLLDMAAKFELEGKTRVAVQACRQALEIRPTCASCHESLGRLLQKQNLRKEAERHMAKARLFRRDR